MCAAQSRRRAVDMDVDEFFSTHWPAMVPTLRAILAKAGAPPSDRDDLVQETAVRLLGMWATIDWDRSIEALARTIALNVWRDQWRHRGEREIVGLVPDQTSESDTERTVLARIEVRDVSRALRQLRPITAQLIRVAAAEAEGTATRRPLTAAARMARTRARRALAACLQAASAIAALSWRTVARPARAGGGVAAVAVVAVAFVLTQVGSVAVSPLQNVGVRAATALASATRTAPTRTDVHKPVVSSHNRFGSVRKRSDQPQIPYYRLKAGPAEIDAFVDFDVEGNGVRVSRAHRGPVSAICTYGTTPTVPTIRHC